MSGSANELEFETLEQFYRFYLGEHRNGACRALHFFGTSVSVSLALVGSVTQQWWLFAVAAVCGYAFAWVGHFGFEKNRPATFKHPFRSFLCDWMMWKDILIHRVPLFGELPHEHYAPPVSGKS